MHAIFFVIAGLIFAYWLWGISRSRLHKPKIFWKPTGTYGVLIAAIMFALVGYLLSK
jgi:hypothetical protein